MGRGSVRGEGAKATGSTQIALEEEAPAPGTSDVVN